MYLLELRDCHLYNVGNQSVMSVAKGDIVLVQENKSRGFWNLEV